jgi:hypothetical protein
VSGRARFVLPLVLLLAVVVAGMWLWRRDTSASDGAAAVAWAPPAPASASSPEPGAAVAPPAGAVAGAPAPRAAVAEDSPVPAAARPGGQLGAGAPAGDPRALQQAMAETTPRQARLMANLSRANVEVPPELRALFQKQRDGASPEQLRRYVRERFPTDAMLRLLTIKWINETDPSAPAPSAAPLPGTAPGGLHQLGRVQKLPDTGQGNDREAPPARTVPVKTP